ncbi:MULTISPECIES: hypothetical protein [Vibrio]|uniref:hypothetical protein n=1 Tax=Vibrio TaxID=662 RepID=UPI00078EC59B|nr:MULTISPECIES: hypothetical protein [Vibrio]BAU70803.1 hypothetical protein [Vibrio sp. 04Ya108]BBM67629.1 hypothetical protein VA249_42750 [Vibrio alfacsensis]BCN27111.1 hypothetical protein VYA_43030 [Vibrio alfacsensis]
MISNSTINRCKLERKKDFTYLVTPEKSIDCELPLPPELISTFEDRELLDSEIEVIKKLRDRGQYTSFDQPFKDMPIYSFGKLIAFFVARNNNCITINENEYVEDDKVYVDTISVEYNWSAASNGHHYVELGGVYDMVTNHGIATVIVIEKLNSDDFLTRYEDVKVFVLSDVMFSVTGTDRYIRQLSKVNVSSRNLIKKDSYYYN